MIIFGGFKSHKRNKKENECIADYVVEKKKLSVNCYFGTYLQQALRDRQIQTKLLTEADLTFDRAVKIAITMETVEKVTYTFCGKEKSETIHANTKFETKNAGESGLTNKVHNKERNE